MKVFSISSIAAVLICLVTLAVYLPALNNGLVNWDDNANFLSNTQFQGFSRSHLHWMWTTHLMGRYIPITWMTLGLDYTIWKGKPFGYHLTNILWHAVNAALFYWLAFLLFERTLSGRARTRAVLMAGAAFAALFFSLHPLRVESVAWVTERRDVVSGAFFLLALLAYLKAFPPAPQPADLQPAIERKYYWACFGFFILAILSKEIVVTFPVLLLLLDFYPLRRLHGPPLRWLGPSFRWVWLEKIPFFVIGGLDSVMALYVGVSHHAAESLTELGLWPRIMITLYDLGFYLEKTLAPVGLSPLYPVLPRKISLAATPFELILVIVAGITVMAILLTPRKPALLLVWIAYAVILLPVAGLFHNGAQIAADRYTYLACLGWALLAGAGLALAWAALGRSVATWGLAGAAVAVLATLGWLTRDQIRFWRDSDSLWMHAISVEPSPTAYQNLGASFLDEGDILGAMDQFRSAIAIQPNSAASHHGLGRVLLDLHRWDEATQEFRRAEQLMPDMAQAYNGMCHSLLMQGKTDDAVIQCQTAVRLDPGNPGYRKNLKTAGEMKLRLEQQQTLPAGENH